MLTGGTAKAYYSFWADSAEYFHLSSVHIEYLTHALHTKGAFAVVSQSFGTYSPQNLSHGAGHALQSLRHPFRSQRFLTLHGFRNAQSFLSRFADLDIPSWRLLRSSSRLTVDTATPILAAALVRASPSLRLASRILSGIWPAACTVLWPSFPW